MIAVKQYSYLYFNVKAFHRNKENKMPKKGKKTIVSHYINSAVMNFIGRAMYNII